MKVFLGNAPWQKDGQQGVRAGSRWPHWLEPNSPYMPFPFYLAYATSVLEQAGHEVKIVDAIADSLSLDEFVQEALHFKPDLIVLETSTPSFDADLEAALRLKKDTKALMTFSGPHVSVFQDTVLKENPEIDFILVGEYEYTLRDLVDALKNKTPLSEVLGLIYRDNSGKPVANPRRPTIDNVDELPWPAYQQLPLLKYNDDFAGLLPRPNVQMWASRGCPFRCNFCLWPQVVYANNKYRPRDPVKVVDEMEWLIKNYGFKAVYFDDDTFDLGKERVIKLCQEIKKRGITVPWSAMARADTLDGEMLQAMADAGLVAIKYGVESGVQELVNGCGKNLNLDKVTEIVHLTKKAGIKVHLTFTFGLTGETHETIQKTIDYAMELDPDSLQYSIITPFPGTRYYDELKQKGYLFAASWSDFDGNRSSVIRTEALTSDDLINAFNRAYDLWYKRCEEKRLLNESPCADNPWLDSWTPICENESILVINYADVGLALHTAETIRKNSPHCSLSLMSPSEMTNHEILKQRYSSIKSISDSHGLQKLSEFGNLLHSIRKNHYDTVIFLSDNAESWERRFPLALACFSKTKRQIVTDRQGQGYQVSSTGSQFGKIISGLFKK